MKYLLTLILFSLTLSLTAQPKKTSKVIVSLDTSGVFNKIIVSLYDLGYTIENKDQANGFVVTSEKNFSSYSIKIKARVKDSIVVFTGLVASDLTLTIGGVKIERTFSDIYFGGMKGSVLRDAWEKLHSFALSFGGRVSYEK